MTAFVVARVFLAAALLLGIAGPGVWGTGGLTQETGAAPAAPTQVAARGAPLLQAAPCDARCETRLVVLKEQVDLRGSFGRSRADRQRNLVAALRAKAEATQRPLLIFLVARAKAGLVASITPLWVQNAVLVYGVPEVFDELMRRPDVAAIISESTIGGPEVPIPGPATSQVQATTAVEPNIALINAPALWELGLHGEGIVVASMDTGVDVTHPELAARYRGGANSWYDPYGQHPSGPVDRNGHGTWSMGVMVGGSESGAAIGVAPGAQWIAVKMFNDRNQASTSAIHLGYQWLLDPDDDPATPDAPDVVNNSWTYGAPGCDLEFQPDLAALAAAGITPVFAAGNFGPGDATDASPSNNPSALPVGATDNAGAIYSDSSRGPTSCGGASHTFPDLVAPGVDTLTTDLYGLYTRVTGTSFAAPHVSGALALLLDAYPDLTVDQQRQALLDTSHDLGPAGPDNAFGAGLLDVLAAYNSLAGASSAIFADGFESGDFGPWTAAQTDGGRLTITSTAALSGTQGLRARLDGGAPVYVSDSTPAAERDYNARFYYSPAGAMLPRGLPHALFAAFDGSGQAIVRVEVQSMSRKVQVRAVAQSSGADVGTPWTTISSTKHALEIGWAAASSEAGSDGRLTFYIDGMARTTLGDLATGGSRIEEARLGPYAGTPSATWGDEYFDEFSSTRGEVIGP